MFYKRKKMQTLEELQKYLAEEGCSKVSLGREYADGKFLIWQEADRYCFAYCERGNLSNRKAFAAEKEVVAYTLDIIEHDLWTRAHLAAWTWSVKDILDAEEELKRRHISFKRNDDLHFDEEHGAAYRIFVFGKDIFRLSDFSKKYYQRLETAQETKKKLLLELLALAQKTEGLQICLNEKPSAFLAAGYYLDEKNSVWRVFET